MKKEWFVFDEVGDDELTITVPEKVIHGVIKFWEDGLRHRRDPDAFPYQPPEVVITMVWKGTYNDGHYVFSQQTGKTTISSFSETLAKS